MPGEEEAWERFVRLYSPLLEFWAKRIGLTQSDADDMVQDVFVVLISKLPEFEYDSGRSFRGWMRTITLNKCRDWLRKKSRSPDDLHSGILRGLNGDNDVEMFAEAEFRERLVARALELMQTEFEASTWKACWETVVHSRPVAEVAQELGISSNSVYLARSRVLRRLREDLDGMIEV